MMIFDLLRAALLYVVVPVWLVAGFADYLCHRASRIECTGGPKESLLHVAQLAEAGLPLLAALLLEINAGVILVMILCLFLHQWVWRSFPYAEELLRSLRRQRQSSGSRNPRSA
jgi:hypothetical protein